MTTSSDRRRIVFFLDRSLGGRTVAKSLLAAGAMVEVHDDHFAADATDREWLAKAGREQWIVLTKDAKIRSRVLERQALMSAAVHAFFVGSGSRTGAQMASAYVSALPAIDRVVQKAAWPVWMIVHPDGHLTTIKQG